MQKYEVPNTNLQAASSVKVPNVKPTQTAMSVSRTPSPMSVSVPPKYSLQTPTKKTPIPASSLTPPAKSQVQSNASSKPTIGSPSASQKSPTASTPTQGQAVTLIRSPVALSNTVHGNIVTNSQGISVLRVQTTQQGAAASSSGLLQLVASNASGGKERFTVVSATKASSTPVVTSTLSKSAASNQPVAISHSTAVTCTNARITSKPQQIVMVMSPVTSNTADGGKVTFATSQAIPLAQGQKSYTAAGLNQILQLSQQGTALKIVTMAGQVSSSAGTPLQTQAGVKIAQPVRLPGGQVVLQMVASAPTTHVSTSISAVTSSSSAGQGTSQSQPQRGTKIPVTQSSALLKLATTQSTQAGSVTASVPSSTVPAANANGHQTGNMTPDMVVSSSAAPLLSSRASSQGVLSVSSSTLSTTTTSANNASASMNTLDKRAAPSSTSQPVSSSVLPTTKSTSSKASVTLGLASNVSSVNTSTKANVTSTTQEHQVMVSTASVKRNTSSSPVTSSTTGSITTTSTIAKSSTVENNALATHSTPSSSKPSSEGCSASVSATISSSTMHVTSKSSSILNEEKQSTDVGSKVTTPLNLSPMTVSFAGTVDSPNVTPSLTQLPSIPLINQAPVTQSLQSVCSSKEAASFQGKVQVPLTSGLLGAGSRLAIPSVTANMASHDSKPLAVNSNTVQGSQIGLPTPVTCGASTTQQPTAEVTSSQTMPNGSMGPPPSGSPANKIKSGTKTVRRL